MPRKSDSKPIENEKLDRRVKLTSEDKENIKLTAETGNYSQRQIASMFGVSRRTIQFILDPEKLEENKKRRKERGGWKQYYDKEKHSQSMKEHREYKKELNKKGLL